MYVWAGDTQLAEQAKMKIIYRNNECQSSTKYYKNSNTSFEKYAYENKTIMMV